MSPGHYGFCPLAGSWQLAHQNPFRRALCISICQLGVIVFDLKRTSDTPGKHKHFEDQKPAQAAISHGSPYTSGEHYVFN